MVASGYMWYYSFNFHNTSLLQSLAVFPWRPFALVTPHRSPAKTLTYWHRPHTARDRLPILFVHDIGIGLYPYVDFLAELNSDGETARPNEELGIIAVEIMSVSCRIANETLEKEKMCHEIGCILREHGWEEFVLVSHS
jgi:hypothetical protein